jgi:ribosomal protein S18 acetylase RimI-like enzyme
MIRKLEHSVKVNAEEIRNVFQVSYKIEAKLLGAKNFPPLSRSIQSFSNSENDFFGYYEEEKLIAVIEMKKELESMLIQSLVVHPGFFRRGIARKLIEFILRKSDSNQFAVETGKDNNPARKLYESFGFQLVKTYNAEENIIKVRYHKR